MGGKRLANGFAILGRCMNLMDRMIPLFTVNGPLKGVGWSCRKKTMSMKGATSPLLGAELGGSSWIWLKRGTCH